MKITIVIEDGRVTTSQEHESPEDSRNVSGSSTQVLDAGAAPEGVRDGALRLAESEQLPEGLEPDYSAAETAAMEDGEDAGASPSFDAGHSPEEETEQN